MDKEKKLKKLKKLKKKITFWYNVLMESDLLNDPLHRIEVNKIKRKVFKLIKLKS